jgi:hypothetical protein
MESIDGTSLATYSGPLTAILSLLLALGLGALSLAVGDRLLLYLQLRTETRTERVLLASSLGLGALGCGLLFLGLLGLLRPWAIWTMLGLAALWSLPPLLSRGRSLRKGWSLPRPDGLFEQLGLTFVLVIVAIVLVRGLAPVTDYDGLAYHLVVPRDYLEAAKIYAIPGEAHANFPLIVDLLFIPGIALGLENTARLIHLGFGLLLGLGVYSLAHHLLGQRSAWLALFVFATTPVVGTVAGYAHTDLGWALFEFLAVYTFLVWLQNRDQRWLVLVGLMAGLGMGSKYLGLPALGVLGLVLLIEGLLLSRRPWRAVFSNGLVLGLVALVVASPWYLKNWIWLGNPFYPLWFGGREWDAYLAAKLEFMGTNYGPRRGPLAILLLPLDIFIYSFGYFGPIPLAFPPPPSLLLPLYAFVKRHRAVSLLLLIAILRFATWVLSARNTRYLLDIYPLLSVASAYLLTELARRKLLRSLGQVLVLILMVANLTWQALLLIQEDPIPVLLGRESPEAYLLDHNHPPYRAIHFINQLPPGSKVLFVGNGQSYYVIQDKIADVNHSNWGHLIHLYGEEPRQLREALAAQGITHIFFTRYDFLWQMNFDDGHLGPELALFDRFSAQCAELTYDEQERGQVYTLLDQCQP